MKKIVALLMLLQLHASAQKPSTSWHASWISNNREKALDYGIYYFRRSIDLQAKPDSFRVHVSADNRYKLYVNGTLVSLGPARSDLYHWNYVTVNLSPYLTAGKNVVAAVVWNEAANRPEAQISLRTGFIIQGASEAEEILNTDNHWKVYQDMGYQPIGGYGTASDGEYLDRNRSVNHWMDKGFDDSSWPSAVNLFEGHAKGFPDADGWMLVPASLPQMEMTYQRINALRNVTGISAPADFPGQKTSVTIPANTTATFLLDQTYETNAYLTLNFNKGAQAAISIRYAESLYKERTPQGWSKGNRNDVEGKIFMGRLDSLISDGSNGQVYTTLNFRTFRYIQLRIQTRDEPLVLDDIYGTFTGYPFAKPSQFVTENEEIKKMLEIGWRTARLNAWETYTDCPYYEQLQYVGDTRVQAMVTYYNSEDARLPRNAIELLGQSRMADGLTMSRYPTRSAQIIPTFSLWYIGMLHDYWMYRDDGGFLKEKLQGERDILQYFSRYQDKEGSLVNVPFWMFVDWAGGKDWSRGAPPPGSDGSTAVFDIQLLWAYQWASELEGKLGEAYFANLYAQKAAQLKQTIQRKYWNAASGLYADTRDQATFSQHTNSLAILTGLFDKSAMPKAGKRLLTDTTLTQCSIYFKYYLHQALVKAGLGDQYLSWLDIWRENMAAGLTTWTEDSGVDLVRSDCHAWGSSPNIEFFRTVLGIDSDAPGFAKVKITPHLGALTDVGGTIPHPKGKVTVRYKREGSSWKVNITLPVGTTGQLDWKGKPYELKAGVNDFTMHTAPMAGR